jgi:nucleotidyltransferase/DNA polymerase involved in DNA repair
LRIKGHVDLALPEITGITQKYLLVTSNYPARRCGVTKLMGITEAQQKCPDLVLVSGEDLTPYRQLLSLSVSHQAAAHDISCSQTPGQKQKAFMRNCRQASKRILAVLQRFGVCERGGMDEMLVDVTAEAHNRALQGSVPAQWAAHVHSNKVYVWIAMYHT